MSSNETILTYEHDGKTYEIDHLACADFDQWGQFAVYQDEKQVGGFAIDEDGEEIPLGFAGLRGSPPDIPDELPITDDALIELARRAVAEG